jgi:tRNA-splicing ligase RtcB
MIVGQIMRDIPTGFSHHSEKQDVRIVDKITEIVYQDNKVFLKDEIQKLGYQIGTLGGGNHFIELQEDSEGKLGIMLHSGSRHFGYVVAKHFNKIAQELNKKWYTSVPEKYQLSFLPIDYEIGQEYIRYMKLAMQFAKENRKVMLERIKVNSSSEYYGLSWRHHNTTIIPVKFYIYTLY